MKNLEKINGDASFRKFFRKKYKKSTSIIVFAKKEKEKNLLIYDSINRILNKNNILAPRLYKENYNDNFIEIEDFGNNTIYKILNKNNKDKLILFKKIIKKLNQLQLIKNKKIKNFKNKIYTIPNYDKKILIKEANLFCDWYVKKNLSKKKRLDFKTKYNKIIRQLTIKIKLKNDVFVHRDFHISNLMIRNKEIAIIDSQDALIGNKAYDLASLIDDVRFKTSKKLKEKIYNFYIQNNRRLNKNQFKNDFEILSTLRNLKIIGIFTRLALRDKKRNYLKLIPYAWRLINMRMNQNKIFKDLKELLIQNFNTQIK